MARTVTVHVGSILYDYTDDARTVVGEGATLRALLADLDRRHPGLRFRVVDEQDAVRPHDNVFVGGRSTRDLATPIGPGEDVHVLGALSGG